MEWLGGKICVNLLSLLNGVVCCFFSCFWPLRVHTCICVWVGLELRARSRAYVRLNSCDHAKVVFTTRITWTFGYTMHRLRASFVICSSNLLTWDWQHFTKSCESDNRISILFLFADIPKASIHEVCTSFCLCGCGKQKQQRTLAKSPRRQHNLFHSKPNVHTGIRGWWQKHTRPSERKC